MVHWGKLYFFFWQGVNETKKVKKPCSDGTRLAGKAGLYVEKRLIVTPCKDIDLDANDCDNFWVDRYSAQKIKIL